MLNVSETTIHYGLSSDSIELNNFLHDQKEVPTFTIGTFKTFLSWEGIVWV